MMLIHRFITLSMATIALFACLLGSAIHAAAQTPTPAPSQFQEAQPALRDLLPAYDDTDVIETESGLHYVILDEGDGDVLRTCDTVATHYTAYLANGTQFDTSDGRPPFSFVLDTQQVIAGWDEGIQLLSIGAKAILMIPPDLGYGDAAVSVIPPNSTLYFDIELVDASRAQQPSVVETVTTLDNGITYATLITGTQSVDDDEIVILEYMLWATDGCIISGTAQNDFRIVYQPGGDQAIAPVVSGTVGIELGEVRQMFWPADVMFDTGLQPISYTVEVTAVNVLAPPPDAPQTITATDYITTERGVQYATLDAGDGAEIQPLDTLGVIYHVWTAAGDRVYSTLFSGNETVLYTYGRNDISGFDEGLRGAKVGETRQLVIPAGIAPPDASGVSGEIIVQIEIVPPQVPSAVGLTSQSSSTVGTFGIPLGLFIMLMLLSINISPNSLTPRSSNTTIM